MVLKIVFLSFKWYLVVVLRKTSESKNSRFTLVYINFLNKLLWTIQDNMVVVIKKY